MSIADEIAKLHELLAKGAITQAEFDSAKARLLTQELVSTTPFGSMRLSRTDRWIAGVCGGLARKTGVESWIVRLIFAVGLLVYGATFIVYLILWIFVPRED